MLAHLVGRLHEPRPRLVRALSLERLELSTQISVKHYWLIQIQHLVTDGKDPGIALALAHARVKTVLRRAEYFRVCDNPDAGGVEAYPVSGLQLFASRCLV